MNSKKNEIGLLNGKMKRAGFLAALAGLFSFRQKPSKSQDSFTIPRFERIEDVPSDLKENGVIALVDGRIVVFGGLSICRGENGVPLKFFSQDERVKTDPNVPEQRESLIQAKVAIPEPPFPPTVKLKSYEDLPDNPKPWSSYAIGNELVVFAKRSHDQKLEKFILTGFSRCQNLGCPGHLN